MMVALHWGLTGGHCVPIPSPGSSLPRVSLAAGVVEHMDFSHLIAPPWLGFSSYKTSLLGLVQEEFASWPISFCRHCSSSEVETFPEEVKEMSPGSTNPRKVRWRLSHCSQPGWATPTAPSHASGESLFCPAVVCFPCFSQGLASQSRVGVGRAQTAGICLGNNTALGEFTPRGGGHIPWPSLLPGPWPCRNWVRSFLDITES